MSTARPPEGAQHRSPQGEGTPGIAADPAPYLDNAAYAGLWALWREVREHTAQGVARGADGVARLLYQEARLLDERLYDDWLATFLPQCLYWVPRRFEPADPRTESSIYLDDRRRLGDRVAMIRSGHLHAQTPPSRTRRMLANIEHWAGPGGSIRARANVVIWEYRKGQMRAYAGSQVYALAPDVRGRLAVQTKIVHLLDSDAPQGNYAFIL